MIKMADGVTAKFSRTSALLCVAIVVGSLPSSFADSSGRRSPAKQWSWDCDAVIGQCRKVPVTTPGTGGLGLEACRLTCGRAGALWPMPTGTISLGSLLSPLNPEGVAFTYTGQSEGTARLIAEAVRVFQGNLRALVPRGAGQRRAGAARDLSILVSVAASPGDDLLTWDTDEGYSLRTTAGMDGFVDASINASSFFGARHGLETLSQLVAWDDNGGRLVVAADASVLGDRPVYPHRGLLVDPARNFLPMTDLYRQVDAMASCKMNVLHLHLTDTQGFPYTSRRVPVLTDNGALQGMAYSPADIASLVHYAKVRGVRVLPEFDAPAHAGAGWDAASERLGKGQLAVCVNQQPWRKLCIEPPCGQLNPVNPDLYPLLGGIYADMAEDFGAVERLRGSNLTAPLLHMGGDEVHLGCWNSSAEIIDWMESNGYPRTKEGFLALWAEFQARALVELDRVSGVPATAILWTSDLTSLDVVEDYLDKSRYVIQAWMPAAETLPLKLLDKGYRLIFSTKDAWYLDHGYGNWKGSSISGYPFHPWQVVYDNGLPPRTRGGSGGEVLGGEAATWGEMVDGVTLDAKTWPRAAATAERLWSDPRGSGRRAKSSWLWARTRMMSHRERMVSRGIRADALQPKWCYYNEGECA
ncbi:chitooligosaccharidolytic beta-N-acetylglucosaminidase-like [Hetaerina americana]|uniref:chitooligosaccharidolytic beta-N-acetylglucosaminidase-like n=1 Tax=Hetaerina americana TaxID=62018 RepID=UPI003A7F13C2